MAPERKALTQQSTDEARWERELETEQVRQLCLPVFESPRPNYRVPFPEIRNNLVP